MSYEQCPECSAPLISAARLLEPPAGHVERLLVTFLICSDPACGWLEVDYFGWDPLPPPPPPPPEASGKCPDCIGELARVHVVARPAWDKPDLRIELEICEDCEFIALVDMGWIKLPA